MPGLAPLALSLADVEQFALTDLASRRALLLIVEHRPLLDQEVLLREDIERIVAREARTLEDFVEPPAPEVASGGTLPPVATPAPEGAVPAARRFEPLPPARSDLDPERE